MHDRCSPARFSVREKKQKTQITDARLGCLSRLRQILGPLFLMHRSLVESGQKDLAGGPLVDLIRRVQCFGVCLAPLDLRQVGGGSIRSAICGATGASVTPLGVPGFALVRFGRNVPVEWPSRPDGTDIYLFFLFEQLEESIMGENRAHAEVYVRLRLRLG